MGGEQCRVVRDYEGGGHPALKINRPRMTERVQSHPGGRSGGPLLPGGDKVVGRVAGFGPYPWGVQAEGPQPSERGRGGHKMTSGQVWNSTAPARNLQQAFVHGILLYGTELRWNGTKMAEREVQGLTNRLAGASLGVRRTTPLGVVTAESALPPVRALLDRRQDRFALRLMARPRGGGEQEEVWRGVASRTGSRRDVAWAGGRRWRSGAGKNSER